MKRCIKPSKPIKPILPLLVSSALVFFPFTTSARAEAGAVQTTVLVKTGQSWDGANYERYPAGKPEITILKISIPANTTLPWHVHPMPNAGYVLSGSLFVESQDRRHRKTLHAGDVLPETVGTIHRGATHDEPAELIVFYAGANGMPLAEAAK